MMKCRNLDPSIIVLKCIGLWLLYFITPNFILLLFIFFKKKMLEISASWSYKKILLSKICYINIVRNHGPAFFTSKLSLLPYLTLGAIIASLYLIQNWINILKIMVFSILIIFSRKSIVFVDLLFFIVCN